VKLPLCFPIPIQKPKQAQFLGVGGLQAPQPQKRIGTHADFDVTHDAGPNKINGHQAASVSLVEAHSALADWICSSVIGGLMFFDAASITKSTHLPFGMPLDFQFEIAGWPQPRSLATTASPPSKSNILSSDRFMAWIIHHA
jgi:hypothetical protein